MMLRGENQAFSVKGFFAHPHHLVFLRKVPFFVLFYLVGISPHPLVAGVGLYLHRSCALLKPVFITG